MLNDRLRTLAYPYVVWSLATWGMHVAASGVTNHSADPAAPLRLLIDPSSGAWFLYVLFVLTLGYALWVRRLGGGPLTFLLAAAAVHAAAILFDGLPTLPARLAQNALYFAVGLTLAGRVAGWASRISPRLALGLAFVGLAGVTIGVRRELDASPLTDALPAMGGTIGLFGLAVWLRGLGWLRYLGRHSLEIYLCGGLASVALRVALARGLGATDLVLHAVIGTVAGLAAPLGLAAICRTIGFRYMFTWPKSRAAA